MRVLATSNIKGGVGKTATSVNLAYVAAREGARVLLWDLDPQGAASFYFRVRPKVKGGAKRLVRGKRSLDAIIKGSDYDRLDIVPADFSYRHLDLLLDGVKKPEGRLRKLLRPIEDEYDYVFFDCAPGISLVTESVFEAADALLVPLIPTTLSTRTLEQLLRYLEKHREAGKPEVFAFFSLADRRKRLHRDIMAELPKTFPQVLAASIPQASEVERMGVERRPVSSYAGTRSRAVKAYDVLWREIRDRCEKAPAPVD